MSPSKATPCLARIRSTGAHRSRQGSVSIEGSRDGRAWSAPWKEKESWQATCLDLLSHPKPALGAQRKAFLSIFAKASTDAQRQVSYRFGAISFATCGEVVKCSGRRPGGAETRGAAAEVRGVPAAERRTAEPGGADPATAPHDAVPVAHRDPGRTITRSVVIVVMPGVLAPLQHISMHVMQTVGVGFLLLDGMQAIPGVASEPSHAS